MVIICDTCQCLYENYDNLSYSAFVESGMMFMLKLFNVYRDSDDLEDILRDIHEKEFFDFLSKIVDFSLKNDFKYFLLVLKIYNSVFSIDIDEPLVELYNNYNSTFYRLFDTLDPNLAYDFNNQLIHLLANTAYSDKNIAHELIDKNYFQRLLELLKVDIELYEPVIYAFDKVFNIADQDYNIKVFNNDPELVHILFAILKKDITDDECKVILSFINFLLNINEDNSIFVEKIKGNEAYCSLLENNFDKNAIQTIENEN